MEQQTVVPSCSGILLNNEKWWTADIHDMDEFQVHCAKGRKPILVWSHLSDNLERYIYWDKTEQWYPGVKELDYKGAWRNLGDA